MAADFQFIVAELSLALAGFSGVVVAMSKQFGTMKQESDTYGLVFILLASGVALLFALLPFAASSAGFTYAEAYTFISLLLAMIVAVATLLAAIASRNAQPRYPLLFWSLLALGFGIGVIHILSFFDVFPNTDMYPLLLLWLLAVAFVQFFVFIFVLWIETDGSSKR